MGFRVWGLEVGYALGASKGERLRVWGLRGREGEGFGFIRVQGLGFRFGVYGLWFSGFEVPHEKIDGSQRLLLDNSGRRHLVRGPW